MPETLQFRLIVGAYDTPHDVEGQFDYVRFDCPAVASDCDKIASTP